MAASAKVGSPVSRLSSQNSICRVVHSAVLLAPLPAFSSSPEGEQKGKKKKKVAACRQRRALWTTELGDKMHVRASCHLFFRCDRGGFLTFRAE